jgi:TrmH family RNA methyltransferase
MPPKPSRRRTLLDRPPPAPSAEPLAPSPLSRAELADLRALLDKRERAAQGRFLVEGFHGVEEALRNGAPVELVVIGEGASLAPAGARVLAHALASRLALRRVPREQVDALADAEAPQGVVAVVRAPAADAPLPLARDGLVVVLDGLQDPGNAGAIVRSADAFGAAAVVFARGTVDPWNPKVLRGAQGSHFHLPVRTGPSAAEIAAAAKSEGHRVVATEVEGGVSLWEAAPLPRRACLILGNESRGVSPEALAAADARVTIPLRGRAESLGVAAAAAVALAWLSREARSP